MWGSVFLCILDFSNGRPDIQNPLGAVSLLPHAYDYPINAFRYQTKQLNPAGSTHTLITDRSGLLTLLAYSLIQPQSRREIFQPALELV